MRILQVPFGLAVSVSLIAATCFAQKDLPCLTGITAVEDGTCQWSTNGEDCNGIVGHGCQSADFTVNCDGDYSLYAEINNCTEGCKPCMAEAYIYKQSGELIACIPNWCGITDCPSQSFTASLYRGTTYTLYACKIECFNQGGCGACGTACIARAKVTE